ncbi:MAG: hypothetical protein R3B47_14230 [Bacteroidia bacterium]
MAKPDTTLSDLNIPNPVALPVQPTTYYVTGTDRFPVRNDTSIFLAYRFEARGGY